MDPDPVTAARRELHELTILSSALLRLATRVQSRCDALRHTLGDVGPIAEAEVDRHAPRPGVSDAEAHAGPRREDDDDPAALLAMSLAGEGMSRAQIADYLRQSFGMQAPEPLLDRVLGADQP